MRLIDADALYERTAEWEARALAEVEKHDPREDREEWQKWTHILNERTAFKHDVADAPTIDAVQVRHGEWYGEADGYADGELVYDMWYCPFCGKRFEEWDEKPNWNYCPNCGADMRTSE